MVNQVLSHTILALQVSFLPDSGLYFVGATGPIQAAKFHMSPHIDNTIIWSGSQNMPETKRLFAIWRTVTTLNSSVNRSVLICTLYTQTIGLDRLQVGELHL